MIFISKYHSLLTKYPLATKSITGGFIVSMGDLVVQTLESKWAKRDNKEFNFNIKRLGIAWIMGNVFMMPLFHLNLTYILPFLVKKLPFETKTPFKRIFGSLLIDQTIWSCYLVCHYLMIINLLENGSFQRGIESIQNNFSKVIITNWQIWPAAQIINFGLIPRPYQVLWMNFIGFFWNIYLSYIQHNRNI